VCDYITINVSSPNTPGLRDLAGANQILNIVDPVLSARATLRNRNNKHLPVFVKLAPDFTDDDLVQVLEALKQTDADGVILTNTTVSRTGLQSEHQAEIGGLSGAPLIDMSEHCLKLAHQVIGGQLPIISVGGVMSGEDALRRLTLGASLVQIYTGLIYRGPGLVKEAVRVTQ
jgi:dihydroorotate dehydrogenase